MKILVACEESQAVTKAFRKKGHEAYSCDIIECSGGHPEWHYDCCVEGVMKVMLWDMIIAHPPCTTLSKVGNRYLNLERYGEKAKKRILQRKLDFDFFMTFVNYDCEKICIENPVGYCNTHYRKPDQIIQPYQFGNPVKKTTCLWLKGLPLLKPSKIVEPKPMGYFKTGKRAGKPIQWTEWKQNKSKVRSKTFPEIAEAMANQWG